MRAALSDRCRYSAPGLTRAIELCYNQRPRDARHIAMAQPVVRQPDNRWVKAVHAGLYASFDPAAAPARLALAGICERVTFGEK